jgi:hypothetical protein
MALISFGVYLDPHQEEFGDYGNAAVTTLVGTTSPVASIATSGSPPFYAIMRGRNTGAGAAYVYWLSENKPDPAGLYYAGPVPFSQLADIIWAATRYVS